LLTEWAIKDMAAAFEQIGANSASHNPDIAPTSCLVVELQGKLETFSSSVCSRLDHLNNLCSSSRSSLTPQPDLCIIFGQLSQFSGLIAASRIIYGGGLN